MITIETRATRIYLRGDTFGAKDRIKAAGGHWDPDERAWWLGKAKAAEAEEICKTAPEPAPRVEGKCSDCGKSCKSPYTLCWDCRGKRDQRQGKCGKCHESMTEWERRHGMRLCRNCRDGGGNAQGGQSYYDRHGHFVLGDDD